MLLCRVASIKKLLIPHKRAYCSLNSVDQRRNHEKAERKLYNDNKKNSDNRMNKIVDYASKIEEQQSRPEFVDEHVAKGTQGLSEEEFRREILEKRLDIEFGTNGQPEVASTSKERIVDEGEYEKRVPLNQDLNF